MIFRYAFSVALVASILTMAAAQADARKLTLAEATTIEREVAVEQGWSKLRGFGFESHGKDDNQFDPGFYNFDMYWDNPEPGSAVVGYVAVDSRTGDAWDFVVCEAYDSPALEKLKQNIRRRAGLSEREYNRIRRRGPMCMPDTQGRLSVEDMKTLVLEYAREKGLASRPHFAVEDQGDEGSYSDFRVIAAFWDETGQSVQATMQLMVDKNTGDLWDKWPCVARDSSKLEDLKRAIRRRRGISQAEYEKLRQLGPYCQVFPPHKASVHAP